MSFSSRVATVLAVAFTFVLASSHASAAFVVWAQKGESTPDSSLAGNPLLIGPGVADLDFYLGTEGESNLLFGFTIKLSFEGSGSIVEEGGTKLTRLGEFVVDDGVFPDESTFLQLNKPDIPNDGIPIDLTSGQDGVLYLFSFKYDTSSGDKIILKAGGSGDTVVLDQNFAEQFLTQSTLVATAVPLPGSIILFLSGFAGLGAMKSRFESAN